MKTITIILLLSLCCSVVAQKSIFVRVYDLEGKKMNKGRVLSVTNPSLHLKKGRRAVIIPVQNIGYIKTKRSEGHNVLVGSLIGLTTGTIAAMAYGNSEPGITPPTIEEGLAVGAILGLPVGCCNWGNSTSV